LTAQLNVVCGRSVINVIFVEVERPRGWVARRKRGGGRK